MGEKKAEREKQEVNRGKGGEEEEYKEKRESRNYFKSICLFSHLLDRCPHQG